MKFSSWWLTACLTCGLSCAATMPVAALAGEGSEVGQPLGAPMSLSSDALVIVGSPEEGEQLQAEGESRHADPELVPLREASQTQYEGLNTGQAARLDDEAFPAVVNEVAGGPPSLSYGERIVGYPTDNVAQVEVQGGGHAVVESLNPIAVKGSSGSRVPIDLGLVEGEKGFGPKVAAVEVHIPVHLGEGAELPDLGVSLTPVDGHGTPLGSADGVVDGATVFYGDSEDEQAGVQDMDTLVKPDTLGVSEETVLRSQRSPRQLFFKVGLPDGASMSQEEGSGAVQVLDAGHTLATISAPGAQDAEGTPVPVSLGVSGDILELKVDREPGEYRYPIVVDPSLWDKWITTTGLNKTNWHYETTKGAIHFIGIEHANEKKWTIQIQGSHTSTEAGALVYTTQGESSIRNFSIEGNWETTGGHIENMLQIVKPGTKPVEVVESEGTEPLPASWSGTGGWSDCPKCFESPYHMGATNNSALFAQQSNGAGGGTGGEAILTKAEVFIEQEKGPEVSFDKTHATVDGGRTNVLYGSGTWLGPNSGAFEIHAKDPGIGVSWVSVDSASWFDEFPIHENGECTGGVQCPPEFNRGMVYNSSMANGEELAEATACDMATLPAQCGLSGQQKIKVDGAAPHALMLNGLPSNGEINELPYALKASATDGSGTTPSSGIASIKLSVDGQEVSGKPSGSCSRGPCTATGEWTLNGEAFGVGKQTLKLTATDNAGNVAVAEYPITIRHATPMAVGPGTVNPTTGQFTLQASDASFGSLSVRRTYQSRELAAGAEGPLGPQWRIGTSSLESLEALPDGSVMLMGSGGVTHFGVKSGGGFTSPTGDSNLTLSAVKEGEAVKEYVLANAAQATTTRFTLPSGSKAWMPTVSEGAVATDTVTDTYRTAEPEAGKKVVEPVLEVAPHPSLTCTAENLEKGCHALEFLYATATTATGEGPGQWGDYNGRLKEALVIAYNPASKAMQHTTVAKYQYDLQGRLRAEWDPRISPALKTTYAYDAEGHVVAVGPPGEEPWLLRYGTIPADASPGRLLSAIRPAASSTTQLKEVYEEPAPVNTGLPTLSNTGPVIGTTLSVSSNGSWSNSPLAYSYQWQDCNSAGLECSVIPGAVNQTYTPQARDAGYALVASVTATNTSGAVSAASAASKPLAGSAPAYSSKFGSAGSGEGQFSLPAGDAIDASGDVWVVDRNNSRIEEFGPEGKLLKTYGSAGTATGQFKEPQGIAINQSTGNVYVADKGNNRVQELNSKGEWHAYGSSGSEPGQMKSPVAVAIAPNGDVLVADYANNRVDELSEAGESLGSFGTAGEGNGQFKGPYGIAVSGTTIYVVDSVNNRVQAFSLSGAYEGQFGTKGTGSGQFTTPLGIAEEPVSGDLYVVDSGNSRLEEFNPAGIYLSALGSKGSGNGQFSSPESVAVSAAGNAYVSDSANNRVQELAPTYSTNNPVPTPPSVGTSAVSTIEYQVPVSGAGAPYAMGSKEVEEGWAQKDDPVEATAIFPPDEPMGWPAADYTRAGINYFDRDGRTVNTAAPGGGIATSEYNETNDMTRALSADDRAASLKEGAKSATESQKLDTESTYNAEGTELLETLGPEHKIKLEAGSEVQARAHARYFYDEGAPASGGPYRLVTKTVDGALIAGAPEEAQVRVTNTSYSGQQNLGWSLRRPTSVTSDPTNGLTGVLTQSFGSLGSGSGQFNAPLGVALGFAERLYVADTKNNRVQMFVNGVYTEEFGKATGLAQLVEPEGIAVTKTGNVYVADTGQKKIKEYSLVGSGIFIREFGAGEVLDVAVSPSGNVYATYKNSGYAVHEFTETGASVREFGETSPALIEYHGYEEVSLPYGIAVSPEGSVYVTNGWPGEHPVQIYSETGAYKTYLGQGSEGTGTGQFKDPEGISIPSTGEIYVADTNNNRVQQFTSKGEYIAQYGTEGTGKGQLEKPGDVFQAPTGGMVVADSGNNRVQVWGAPTSSKLNLVHTTVYEPLTGDVVQTRSPGAGSGEPEGSASYLLRSTYGSLGSGNSQFNGPRRTAVSPNGNVYVVDTKNNRVEILTATGEYLGEFGKAKGSGELIEPRGIAIAENGNIYVADTGQNKIKEYDESVLKGSVTYIREFGAGDVLDVATSKSGNVYGLYKAELVVHEFTETGASIREFGIFNLPIEHYDEQWVTDPRGIAVSPVEGTVYITDPEGGYGESPIQEFTETGSYKGHLGEGKEGAGSDLVKKPEGIDVASNGAVYVADTANNRVEQFGAKGEYIGQYGSVGSGSGQLKEPDGVAIAPGEDMYILDTGNNRIQRWIPPGEKTPPTQTVYYTAGAQGYPECENHPEWAGLVCQTRPGEEPEDSLPKIPFTTFIYNMWDEPERSVETFGFTESAPTRTKKETFDSAGRVLTSEESASVGIRLPAVTDEYSSETGALVKQSTTVSGKTKTITSAYNTLGQITTYTDAEGNATEYEYEPEKDKRLIHVDDGKGTQSYTYDSTTGAVKELNDLEGANALTFTASYDSEGNMTSESYPNGMSAKYTLNPAGETTGVSYVKTTHCSEACTWYTDSVVPSIHGQTVSQESSLASTSDTYDATGRLTEVQEKPTGEGCVTHLYAYNEETDRTSLTLRAPGIGGACANSGGEAQTHTYDEGNKLTDAGTTYNALGDTTKLPATDAGGSELTSTFYSDGQLETQTQGGQAISYQLDPDGRARETVDTGTVNSTTVSHYSGSGSSPSWTVEPASGHWTRNVSGIGGLDAIETDTEGPVLQLTDLQGNTVATASISETATKLLGTERPTEYGVPTTSKPQKYSWLGGDLKSTELPSGVVAMGARSYVPQIGRFLQEDPLPGGSVNAYTYTNGDPVNQTDLTGGYVENDYVMGFLEEEKVRAVEREAAREAAARAEAERKAEEAMEAALDQPLPGEGAAEPLGGYKGWEDEYGVETGQLPSGTDPYLGGGVYLAVIGHWWGVDVQFHLNKKDSRYIAAIGPGAAAAWTLATFEELSPPSAALISAAFLTASVYNVEQVDQNNCIAINIDDGVPIISYYRSKKECG